ncbi:MAG: VWA domain-containing protein [Pyrinomonadaceae bacterium]|nr:VWA domain-containing protein [Pyrinomonadaceae bacterium]
MLLISDGQDNDSRYNFDKVRRLLQESDVVVYAVGIVSGADSLSSFLEGQSVLNELANASGGRAFFPNSRAQMDDVFEQIALELRHQYSIGYKPDNFIANGKWHTVKVKVKPPPGLRRLVVRTKPGYYAIARNK